MKKIKVFVVGMLALSFASCSVLNVGTYPSYAPVVEAAAEFSTDQALRKIKTEAKKKETAKYLYSIAAGARTLTGKVPSIEEVQKVLTQFGGDNPEIAELVVVLSRVYQKYYEMYAKGDNVRLASMILESIAIGIEAAVLEHVVFD